MIAGLLGYLGASAALAWLAWLASDPYDHLSTWERGKQAVLTFLLWPFYLVYFIVELFRDRW